MAILTDHHIKDTGYGEMELTFSVYIGSEDASEIIEKVKMAIKNDKTDKKYTKILKDQDNE